jgi:hypothetical protein
MSKDKVMGYRLLVVQTVQVVEVVKIVNWSNHRIVTWEFKPFITI